MKITRTRLRQIIKEEVSRAFPYMLAEEPAVLSDEPPPAGGTAAATATSDDPQYPPSASGEKTPLKINSVPWPRSIKVKFSDGDWESVEKVQDENGRSFFQIDVDRNSGDIKIKIQTGEVQPREKELTIPSRYNPRRGVHGGAQGLKMCWDFDEDAFCER